MNSLTAERAAVAEALTDAGIRASEFIPDRISPPIAVVTPGDPYIGPGQTFCDAQVRLDVTLIAATATNRLASEALDLQIAKALQALRDWTVESVSAPYIETYAGGSYLAAQLTLSQYIEIKEEI